MEIQPTQKPDNTIDSETKTLYTVIAISIIGVIANAAYAAFSINYELPFWMLIIVYVSTFTDSVLGLHIGTKITLITASIYKNIGVGIFGAIFVFLINILGMSPLFFSIGLVMLVAIFILFMRIYDIGFLRAMLLIIIQGIIISLINLSIYGLYFILTLA